MIYSGVFPKFNFARALTLGTGNSPLHDKKFGHTMVWDDQLARFAKDQEGFKIVAHFPAFLRNEALVCSLTNTTQSILKRKE